MIEVKDTVFYIGNPIRVGKVVAMAGDDVQVVFWGMPPVWIPRWKLSQVNEDMKTQGHHETATD